MALPPSGQATRNDDFLVTTGSEDRREPLGRLSRQRTLAEFLNRFLNVIFGPPQLDLAVMEDSIAGARIAIQREAHATGIGEDFTVDLAHHWQMRMSAKDEFGIHAGDLSGERCVTNIGLQVLL